MTSARTIPSSRKAISTGAMKLRFPCCSNFKAFTRLRIARENEVRRDFFDACITPKYVYLGKDRLFLFHGVFIEQHADERGGRNGDESADDAGKRGAAEQ